MNTTSPVKRVTPNYNFVIPRFDSPGWGKAVEDAFTVIDGLMFAATGIAQLRGAWQNDTLYAEGDRVIDQANGRLYQATVAHTSAATGTFEDERNTNPDYWFSPSTDVVVRGEFAPTTLYNVGDFVYSTPDMLGGVVGTQFTSSASLRDDIDKLGIIYDLVHLQPATVEDLRAGADNHVIDTNVLWEATEAADLGNLSGSYAIDCSDMLSYAKGVITGNLTLIQPTNMKSGQTFILDLVNNATGGYSFNPSAGIFLTNEGDPVVYDNTANARNIYIVTCLHDGKALINCAGKGIA